jgi:hypothetical protein
MTEFLLIFRNTPPTGDVMPTPEQLKDISKPWMDWIGGIAALDKLSNRGNRLTFSGATVKAGAVTDGPYAEIKEIILGYTIVKADTLAEAIELANGCPVLADGGNVEVRAIAPINV